MTDSREFVPTKSIPMKPIPTKPVPRRSVARKPDTRDLALPNSDPRSTDLLGLVQRGPVQREAIQDPIENFK